MRSVRSVSVQVKTLSIGGKPMPMSFFRQIRNELPNLTPCGRMNGETLGFVDYKWPACSWDYFPCLNSRANDSENDHVHLVWLKDGSELRRYCIDRPDVPQDFLPQLFLTV